MNTRNRLTNRQQLLVIEWIQAGKGEGEIKELAIRENPPFVVSHRKYLRYKADYDPARAREMAGLFALRRAYLLTADQVKEEDVVTPTPPANAPTPPATTQPDKPLAPAVRTIGDWTWEMLFGKDKDREQFTPLTVVRDAFKPWG